MFRKRTLRHSDYETSSQPSRGSKRGSKNRKGGRNDSYASSTNTIDEIIDDEESEMQSVIDVSRYTIFIIQYKSENSFYPKIRYFY